jgi:hypothetical protein
MTAYAFPPTVLIPQSLRKIEETECLIVLVAPAWPAQAWYPNLLNLLVDFPVKLPNIRRLLKQPISNVYHTKVESLNQQVWPLSRDPFLIKDF